MPIYEYECRECRTSFELLMRSDVRVACPRCDSDKVLRKLSMFAAHVAHDHESHRREAPAACGMGECACGMGECGSGMCGLD